jgi:hypothetical protein
VEHQRPPVVAREDHFGVILQADLLDLEADLAP